VAVGIFGPELHGTSGVTHGVVVAVELGRIFGHALVVFAGALRFERNQAIEHGDGLVQLFREHERAFQP
jgi:hypothetical protein